MTVSEKDEVAHMTHPEMIQTIQELVTIPVIARCRIGHFAEAQILESLFVDFIDESEALTPADEEHYIDKHAFRIPFVCGCEDLGSALRRIDEGAAMLRTDERCSVGCIAEAVRMIRAINSGLRKLKAMDHAELMAETQNFQVPYDLLEDIVEVGKLPVPLFASGGIITPADAALMIQLGAESVFVDVEIFDTEDPLQRLKAIVGAVDYYRDPEMLTQATLGHVGDMESERHDKEKEEILVSRSNW